LLDCPVVCAPRLLTHPDADTQSAATAEKAAILRNTGLTTARLPTAGPGASGAAGFAFARGNESGIVVMERTVL